MVAAATAVGRPALDVVSDPFVADYFLLGAGREPVVSTVAVGDTGPRSVNAVVLGVVRRHAPARRRRGASPDESAPLPGSGA